MNRILLLRLLVVVTTLLPVACTNSVSKSAEVASTTNAPPKLEIITREEHFPIEKGVTRLVLRNPHGDVRLRIADQGKVGIYATIQRIGEQPLDPTFDVRQNAGIFELTVRYPNDAAVKARGNHLLGRVDIGVWVPSSMALDIATTDGLLQARRISSPLLARTLSGALEVTSVGDLDVETVSGRISVRQTSGQWQAPIRVVSQTGTIFAGVPAFADIRLSIQAGGAIRLPPELTAAEKLADGSMRLNARYGAALREMHIESVKGDVDVQLVIPDSSLGAKADAPAAE